MIDSVAGIAVLVLLAVVFKNWQAGTLAQWAKAKFFGMASPAGEGQRLVGGWGNLLTGTAAGVGTGASIGKEQAGETGALDLVTIRGVRLRRSVAASWGNLVDAAAADGITITGGGYRSPAEQAALRTSRGCGGTRVNDPTCKCSPPTATPASSEHCKGRAVDVHNCGRGSAAYKWLSANAEKFGWYNLPSESWHWSVSGH